MHSKDKICLRYWHRIYHIERRGFYSFYEIKKLVKDIEEIKNDCPEKERLVEIIDQCYKDMDSADRFKRLSLLTQLRTVFHRRLKEIDCNPLTFDKTNKLNKTVKTLV